jgi:hypothetical protein
MTERQSLKLLSATASFLVILFSGGCGAFFVANADGEIVTWQLALQLSVPFFLFGCVSFWLAMRERL